MAIQPRTHVALLVDASVSMTGVAAGVRVGVNAYVSELREDGDADYQVSVALFNDHYLPLCTGVPPGDVPRLDEHNYRPAATGNTALLDAVAAGIHHVGAQLKPADRVVFVVVSDDSTDNGSTHHSADDVAQMITAAEHARWSFLHLSAGPKGVRPASRFGLHRMISLVRSDDLARTSTFTHLGSATKAIAHGADADLAAKLLLLQLAIASDDDKQPAAS